VLAQGGVDASNAAECVRAGAAGVAVTGAILAAADPAAAAAALRRALDETTRARAGAGR
jgi:thiamine monophosphate synthase